MSSATENRRALFRVAAEQCGYFTAHQASAAGYSYPAQHYHVANGDWIRLDRGIYRLRDYPLPEREDLILLTLRSHDRAGEPQAIASHETALAIHDISDANPARLHLTVPPNFRRRMPQGTVLHRATLARGDWEQRDGYRVTTPLRTILDIARDDAKWIFLEDAVRDALRMGMVRSKHLLAADLPPEARQRMDWALQGATATSREH